MLKHFAEVVYVLCSLMNKPISVEAKLTDQRALEIIGRGLKQQTSSGAIFRVSQKWPVLFCDQ